MAELHCQHCNNPVLHEDCDNTRIFQIYKYGQISFHWPGCIEIHKHNYNYVQASILIMLAYRYFVILQSFPDSFYHLELPRFPVIFYHIFKNNRMEVMLHYKYCIDMHIQTYTYIHMYVYTMHMYV